MARERNRAIGAPGPTARLRFLLADTRVRFLLVGAANTALGYGCFALVHLLAGQRLGTFSTLLLAYAIALPLTFWSQKRLVFRHAGRILPQALRFALANTTILLANLLTVPLLVRTTAYDPLALQLAFVAVATLAAYLAHKHFSFAR